MKKTVLFLCTHNSARSQMAEAFLNKFHPDKYEAQSAGVTPTKVNPYVVKVMAETGVDISKNRSKSIEEFRGKNFNVVVTVCDGAKESCPFFPGEKIIHHSFDDPSQFSGSEQEILKQTRKVRDTIKEWIKETFV
ncbi:MAG: arsenate reductase ArsC [Candidatus Bathyarchaeota archaeon]|nr:arsenate reductase ArsC [Candidatus Bathyarchaeota archaeon]